MDIKSFGKMMKTEIAQFLGDEYKVEYKEVIKNNSVINHSILICKEGENVSPSIYIDDHYDKYKKGIAITKLASDIIEVYQKYAPKESLDMSFYREFSNVAERLSFKVISKDGNEKLLSDIPYRSVLDLAFVPIYLFQSDDIGNGNIVIKNDHLKMWEVSQEELWENVMEGAPDNQPVKIRNLFEMFEELGRAELATDELSEKMLIVTNKDNNYGAASVFYPGVLRELAGKLGGDVFIIPASVHEVIAVPARGGNECSKWLREMVKEVNDTTVSVQDFLSNNVYFYDMKADKLSVCSE